MTPMYVGLRDGPARTLVRVIDTVIVFGATGDLATRFLLPALAGLRASGTLDADVRVVGSGPQPDAQPAGASYLAADVRDATQVAAVLDGARRGPGPVAVYLALPTWLMPDAVRALRSCGLPPGSRLAVEKPFGEDLASAVALNAALAELAGVETYRVDHALALDGAADLAGAVRGPVRSVELLWEETLALEGRAAFYDRAGALRDVLQNHLVQLLCLVAAPAGDGEPADRRAAVLRAVRPLTPADVERDTRRARWTAGTLADGRAVPDYAAEVGVDPDRGTETFAEVALHLDLPQWTGTRFVLRTGKALHRTRRGVVVDGAGELAVDLDPPGPGPGGAEAAAYERVVHDLLAGGRAYAVSAAEVELAWQLLTPVLDGWAGGAVPLASYPAGSAGPGRPPERTG